MLKKIVLFIVLFSLSTCNHLPKSFKTCNRKQEDFQICLKDALLDALSQLTVPFKEVGLPVIEPLIIPSITIQAGAGAAAFTQKYIDMKIHGLSKPNCSIVEADLEKHIIHAQCKVPELKTIFNYEYSGKLLLIPFNGKGPGTATATSVFVDLKFYMQPYNRNNIKYYKVVKTEFIWKPEKIVFDLKNLFGDDEKLNNNLNELFNENWEALFQDVKHSYEIAYAEIFQSIFNKLLAKVPVRNIFGDE